MQINKQLTQVGNYIVVSFEFDDVTGITSISDEIVGENPPNYYVLREFRWSYNNNNWSLWSEYDSQTIQAIQFDPEQKLYMEFKYTAVSDLYDEGDDIDDINIVSIVIKVNKHKSDPSQGFTPISSYCSDEKCGNSALFNGLCGGFSFDPYAVNKGISMYKDLSMLVNKTWGHNVNYYKVDAQQRSADVVLKEYTIYNVAIEKCIKVMVPNNEFPDSKVQFNQYGIDFEAPFEVHIDKRYYEEIFGRNRPQKRDILYFPMMNRIYEIKSAYLFRDFMHEGVYYKVSLGKYEPKANTTMDLSVKEDLESLLITTEELFGKQIEDETRKVTKKEQYHTTTHKDDINRLSINRGLDIIKFDLYNNWTLLTDYYYDMSSVHEGVQEEQDAVVYRSKGVFGPNDSKSFLFWFQFQKDNNSLSRNLIHCMNAGGDGISIEMVYLGDDTSDNGILVNINGTQYSTTITNRIYENEWYAVIINMSNAFGQIGMFLYKMRPQMENTTELRLVHKSVLPMQKEVFDNETNYKLLPSKLNIATVKAFNTMIDEDKHSTVLNQMVVKDTDLAFIIDTCRPLLRIPKITNPK
jgi:hypothetical protein